MFSFQDDDEQWLSLRYDLTAPLARYVAENYERLPKPYRSYRSGWVFRNEKPGPGRFRQFMQFDADTVGAASVAADAEMCMMAADALEALGIPRGAYVIRVNNRKVLDGVMEAIGVADEHQKLAVLRAIDKLDRLGIEGVRELLGPGRRDESGDFTKGAGLDPHQVATALTSLEAGEQGRPHPGRTTIGQEGSAELDKIADQVAAAGYGADRIRIDASVVRGLEYYTGPVFEAELLFETVNEKGEPARFGSVGGGGRYDGLVGRFTASRCRRPASPSACRACRRRSRRSARSRRWTPPARSSCWCSIATAWPTTSDGRRTSPRRHRRRTLSRRRRHGAQMKYADRRNAPLAIIQGGDEKARGVVQIKDLALGKKLAAKIEDNAQWREERPGQEEVAVGDLVEAVNRLLAAASGAPELMTGTYEALRRLFAQAGYVFVEPPIVHPASVFVELAGEDLRRRLYLTNAADGTELALRPDYTIPVCLHHLSTGAAKRKAGYAYLGPVFRHRRDEPGEFLQAGIGSLGRRTAPPPMPIRSSWPSMQSTSRREEDRGAHRQFGNLRRRARCARPSPPWKRRLARNFGNRERVASLIARANGGAKAAVARRTGSARRRAPPRGRGTGGDRSCHHRRAHSRRDRRPLRREGGDRRRHRRPAGQGAVAVPGRCRYTEASA